MWIVEHKGTKIVVGSYATRAAAYLAKKSLQSITDERYVVGRIA